MIKNSKDCMIARTKSIHEKEANFDANFQLSKNDIGLYGIHNGVIAIFAILYCIKILIICILLQIKTIINNYSGEKIV